jgi:hypothetical protein
LKSFTCASKYSSLACIINNWSNCGTIAILVIILHKWWGFITRQGEMLAPKPSQDIQLSLETLITSFDGRVFSTVSEKVVGMSSLTSFCHSCPSIFLSKWPFPESPYNLCISFLVADHHSIH